MSKYTCQKCGQPAEHIDFLNNDREQVIEAVYVFCKLCKIDAWGGIQFHPAMNDLLNQRFSPNFDYAKQDSDRSYILRP